MSSTTRRSLGNRWQAWRKTEGGRSLREVVALIAVPGREKEARAWVEERAGEPGLAGTRETR